MDNRPESTLSGVRSARRREELVRHESGPEGIASGQVDHQAPRCHGEGPPEGLEDNRWDVPRMRRVARFEVADGPCRAGPSWRTVKEQQLPAKLS